MNKAPFPKDFQLPWEKVDDLNERLKVPGGWVLRSYENVFHRYPDGGGSDGWDWRIAMCFIPDPEHTWLMEYQI